MKKRFKNDILIFDHMVTEQYEESETEEESIKYKNKNILLKSGKLFSKIYVIKNTNSYWDLKIEKIIELKKYEDEFILAFKEDNINKDQIRDLKDFGFIEGEILEDVIEKYWYYIDFFDDFQDKFEIYRKMNVNLESFLDDIKKGRFSRYKGIGVYWSWDKKRAEAHWGAGNKEKILLVVDIKKVNIDWITTIFVNCRLNIGKEEAEIRVKKGTQLKIKYIIRENGEKIDLNLKTIAFFHKH